MFLFLVIYISLFMFSFYFIFNNKVEHIIYFLIFGLPIYITTLSVSHLYDLNFLIPFLQFTKEIIIIFALIILLIKNKNNIVLNNLDKLLILYLILVILYIFLPIGNTGLYQRLVATKTIAFFPLVYFVGKFLDPNSLNIEKTFKLISLFGILVACILISELLFYQNLQTLTGYADFMFNIFNQDTSGNYGLTWTFETDNGIKRFASIYSMPLEHAAATLITVSAILSLILVQNNRIQLNKFLTISLIASILSILFAVSRASFLGYILILYAFMLISKNKQFKFVIKYGLFFAFFIVIFLIKDDIKNLFLGTIFFTNSSSLTHLIAWTEAIFTIYNNPMGIGLGSIGILANKENSFFAGENQLLIIGVQVGVIPMIIYLLMYFKILKIAYLSFNNFDGKIRKTALFIFLVKIGLIVPLLTSEIESYIYISYIVWFISGYLINILSTTDGMELKIIHD